MRTKPEVAFEDAKFYDCTDPEVLNHTTVEEALEYVVDGAWEKGESAKETLAKIAPITVLGYCPVKKSSSSITGRGEDTVERLEEDLMEDYGNLDGDHEFWSKEERAELIAKFDAVFKEALDRASVWQCEKVAERTYSVEQVMELIGDYFEDEQ